MTDFYVDERKEKMLVKRVRKTTRRWKIGNMVACVFIIVGIILILALLFKGDVHGAELIASSIAILLIPAIGMLLSAAIARTGGRDILMARLGEHVCISKDEFVESYTPRFKEIDSSSLVENHILFTDVTAIVHESKAYRYLICGNVQTIKQGQFARTDVKHTNQPDGSIVLYDYFVDMPELLELLQKYSGLEIQEVN